MTKHLLDPNKSVLLVVDIQEKFVPVVHEFRALIAKAKALIEGAKLLDVPVVVSEQYPKGLGPTVAELADALPAGALKFEKTAFGCLGDEIITERLASLDRPQVVVCGIEAHVCMNQTVHQLLAAGYEVHLIEDALSARDPKNIEIGRRKMELAGAVPSSVEMALFEWMGHSRHAQFRAVQALIK
ncbi:MAG: hydrolase [Elusimicrobiota bacterium]